MFRPEPHEDKNNTRNSKENEPEPIQETHQLIHAVNHGENKHDDAKSGKQDEWAEPLPWRGIAFSRYQYFGIIENFGVNGIPVYPSITEILGQVSRKKHFLLDIRYGIRWQTHN